MAMLIEVLSWASIVIGLFFMIVGTIGVLRMPDVFTAGYGSLWLPPASKADTGGFSVGYDPFDRFDLGSPPNQTLYGTEEQLKAMVDEAHRAGVRVYFDIVLNHNGFRDASTPGNPKSASTPSCRCFTRHSSRRSPSGSRRRPRRSKRT